MENTLKKQDRLIYLDYLRIFATLAVILIHVSAQNWNNVAVMSYEWIIFNLFNGAVQWAVPVFIMISGALFLDNDRALSVKKLYTGNIFRIATAFLFWSAIYALDQMEPGQSLGTTVKMLLTGHYHMWYLYMIMGFYILTPIFRKITESKAVTEYFLIVIFLFEYVLPGAVSFLRYVDLPHTGMLLDGLEYGTTLMRKGSFPAFTFYFVFGLYLSKYELPVWIQRSGYILAVVGYAVKMGMTFWYEAKTGSGSPPFDFAIHDLCIGTGLFLFAKYILANRVLTAKGQKTLLQLSKCSFGVYLAHVLVLLKFQEYLNLNTLTFNAILSVPLIALGAGAVSGIISLILQHIPILKKYVV